MGFDHIQAILVNAFKNMAGWSVVNGAARVLSATAQSSYGDIKTCIAAPAAGAQVQAFAIGSAELRAKNGSATAAEYVIIGFGESETAAEANRDGTNMLVVLAGESWEDRKSANETHYAWKSATGTPVLWLGEGA